MASRRSRSAVPGDRTLVDGLAGVAVIALSIAALPCAAQEHPETVGRVQPTPIQLDRIDRFHVTTLGRVVDDPGGIAGTCPPTIASHTNADFAGGSFIMQAGFAEDEMAAATYTLPASAFPIRVDLMEMIFATSGATQQTVTQWSISVWEGTPSAGVLIANYSSDDEILPHLRLGPGTTGANIQVSVDPNDPEQIFINNSSGANSFSIGYRIDVHNQQTSNPCFVGPPTCCNAFPCTDVGGLAQPANNWMLGLNCGPLGCPANGGWARFSQLSAGCRPSGDWVMRATWTSVNCVPPTGACCFSATGGCQVLTPSECSGAGGVYQGNSTTCAGANCPQPTGACCFESSGGCLNLSSANCGSAGGQFRGGGTACGTTICFPIGACCLPTGNCQGPVSPETCAASNGVFQGHQSNCGGIDCPDPVGACCFGTFCLILSEAECATGGATWHGLGTDCADGNANGTADQCEATVCGGGRGDADCNGAVNFFDIDPFVLALLDTPTYLITYCNQSICAADADCTGEMNFFDIDPFLGCLLNGCANCP